MGGLGPLKRLRAVFGDRVTIEGNAHSAKTARPVPATDGTGGEGDIEAATPVAPVVIEDVPVGDGTGAEKPLEAPTAVQDGHGEPPALQKTPALLAVYRGCGTRSTSGDAMGFTGDVDASLCNVDLVRMYPRM